MPKCPMCDSTTVKDIDEDFCSCEICGTVIIKYTGDLEEEDLSFKERRCKHGTSPF